jgi:nicotinate-nucleotide adenylyltransferase
MALLPAHRPGQRIGLFGGSFNPPHEGHRQVALYALEHLKLDCVWWLVSPQNPLKDRAETEDYALRLAQSRAMAQDPRFVVTDFEQHIGSQFTAQTLRAVKRESQARFVWIMGADSLAGFHRWQDWKFIFNTVPIAVLARPSYSEPALASPAAQRFAAARIAEDQAGGLADLAPPAWVFLSMPLRHESSSAIRARRKTV